MNKLFTMLCTLVFITACGGSPSWDGTWLGVEDDDITMVISDGTASLTENERDEDICTFDASESEAKLECKDEEGLNIALKDDVITVTMDGDDDVLTFNRE